MNVVYTTDEIESVRDIVLWSEDRETISFSCVWYNSVESVSVFQYAADEPLPKDPMELGEPVAVISRGKYISDQKKIVVPRPYYGRYKFLFVSYLPRGKEEDLIGYYGKRMPEFVCEYSRKHRVTYSVKRTNTYGPKGECFSFVLKSDCYIADGMLYIYNREENRQYEVNEVLPNREIKFRIVSSGCTPEQFELCLSGEITASKYYDIVRE